MLLSCFDEPKTVRCGGQSFRSDVQQQQLHCRLWSWHRYIMFFTHKTDSYSVDFNSPLNFCRWWNRHKNSWNQNQVEQGERSWNKSRSFCQEEPYPISTLRWLWAGRNLQESNCTAKVHPSVLPSFGLCCLTVVSISLLTYFCCAIKICAFHWRNLSAVLL